MAIIKKAGNGKYFVFKDEKKREIGDNIFSLKDTIEIKARIPKELRGRRVFIKIIPYVMEK